MNATGPFYEGARRDGCGLPRRNRMARSGMVNFCALVIIIFAGFTFYQRVLMECNVARKNSVHFERVYDEAQDEVAEWRRRYDSQVLRADECHANTTKQLVLQAEEVKLSSAQLEFTQKENQKLLDEIIRLNAELTKSRETHVDVASNGDHAMLSVDAEKLKGQIRRDL